MLYQDFNNLDGEVMDYDAVLALSPVKNNPVEVENFYPATGTEDPYSKFDTLPSFSNASGKRRAKREVRKEKRKGTILDKSERASRRERRGALIDSFGRRQDTRLSRKQTDADSKRIMAETLGKDTVIDSRSQTQQNQTVTPDTKKGLSKNAKIGIGVAVGVAVLLGVAYMIKKSKSGK